MGATMGLFRLLAMGVNAYALVCVVRVLLSWFPNVYYTKPARFLASICDPYINLFRSLPLRFGSIDFSPALAIMVLGGASTMLNTLATGVAIRIGFMLATVLRLAWQLAQSIVSLAIVLLIVRLICLLVYKSYSSSFWQGIDDFFSPILFGITRLFAPSVRFTTAIIAGIVTGLFFNIVGQVVVALLVELLKRLPI